MADQTSLGIPYPESGDHTRLWEYFQTIADATNTLFLQRPYGLSTAVQTPSNTDTCVTTNTAYEDTAAPLSIGFLAPPSGKVIVHITADIWNAAATGTSWHSYMSFRMSGPTAIAASDSTSAQNYGANGICSTRSVMVTGLTPGGSYTCTMQHRAEAGTNEARFTRRQICVAPLV